MDNFNMYATATFGVESVVARELAYLGYEDTRIDNGRIHFTGDCLALCRANLWLRSAERVYVKIGECHAETFDALFEGAKALPWEEWLTRDCEFPVNGSCVKSTLMSISDCQAIIKKAVVERLKKTWPVERFPEDGPRFRIEFSILEDVVTFGIDSSGAALHKRGYRTLGYTAPIKETLAAAMLLISRWAPGRTLVDPFCGSGTIPIEAAMMERNIAPGLEREFDCQEWPRIPREDWYHALDEARDSIRPAADDIHLFGYDINPDAVEIALHHIKLAGVQDSVHIQRRAVQELSSKAKYGFVVTNPPYGQRIGEYRENLQLYKDMGTAFRKLDTWSFYIINADADFEQTFGRKADKKRKLYNGGLQCAYYQFFGPRPPRDNVQKPVD